MAEVKNVEKSIDMNKVNEMVSKSLDSYKKTIAFMGADAPLGVLCLPRATENALIRHGCLRVYDLFDLDFTEIKGLGKTRIQGLTTCLDQFFAMC